MAASLPFLPDCAGDMAERARSLHDDSRGDWWSYGQLRTEAGHWSTRLAGPRGLVFHYIRNDADNVAALIGAIGAGHAVALFDPALSGTARAELEECYRPDWIVEPGLRIESIVQRAPVAPLHPDLALLLSTSGSTGSPKLVRLTRAAIEANADGIAQVLAIGADDVAAGYLPLHYSYGLSVLTSHLHQGAAIRLTENGLTHRAFWPALREAGVTHMPGVPFHFQIMARLGFARLGLTSLRTLTQAGGSLDTASRRQAHAYMDERGGRFFVLYGQTEAGPRMTTLQHDCFHAAEASVGTPLPGCRIEIRDADADGRGEVIFHGPNAMMGYAERRDDLALGDMQGGCLATGDIGYLDGGGRLFLTGRAKRFGKIYGLRVNLDEVEREASSLVKAAVTQAGDSLLVHLVAGEGDMADEQQARLLEYLAGRFTLPRAAYAFRRISDIPRTERGKVDYAALEKQA